MCVDMCVYVRVSWRTASAKQLVERVHRSCPHFRRYVQQVNLTIAVLTLV